MAKRKYKTNEERKKEIDELTEMRNEEVNKHFQSPEQMKEYTEYMSKFYNYSARNTILIQKQFDGAEAVGSFKFWKEKGFSVQKGEKGIKILTPAIYKTFEREDKNGKKQTPLKYATQQEKTAIDRGEIAVKDNITYRVGYVFDVSQTNATAADLPEIFPNRWIDGEVHNYNEMYQSLEKLAQKMNVDIHKETMKELGAAKGAYVEFGQRNANGEMERKKAIELNPRNSELNNIKTLVHELAHARLHGSNSKHYQSLNHNEKEFQAELTAFTVCSHFNMDTSDYSLNYLYNYTKNHETIHDKMALMDEVKETSFEFITHLENDLTKQHDKAVKEEFFEAIETKYGENPFNNIYDEYGEVVNPRLEELQELMMEHDMLEQMSDPAMYSRDEMEIDGDPYSNEHEKEKQYQEIDNHIGEADQSIVEIENQMIGILESGELNVSKEDSALKERYKDLEVITSGGSTKTIGDMSTDEFKNQFTDKHNRNLLASKEFEKMNNQEVIKAFNSISNKNLVSPDNTVLVDHSLTEPHVAIEWSEAAIEEDLKPLKEMDRHLAEKNIESLRHIGYDKTKINYIVPGSNGVEVVPAGRADLGDTDYVDLHKHASSERLGHITPKTDLSDIYTTERMTNELSSAYNKNLELKATKSSSEQDIEYSQAGLNDIEHFANKQGLLTNNDVAAIKKEVESNFNERQSYKDVANDVVTLKGQYERYQQTLQAESTGELTEEKVINRMNAENKYNSMKQHTVNKGNETNDVITKMESDAMHKYGIDHKKEVVEDNPFGQSKSSVKKHEQSMGL